MPIKCTLQKSYIKAYKVKENLNFNAINIDSKIKSIRYYTKNKINYKIVLTGSHNISIKNNEKKNFKLLEKIDKNKADYCWSNIDIITNDCLPYIGKIEHNLLLATGYNAWGMTNSALAGIVIKDIILNRNNKYLKLFDPKRGINTLKVINYPISISSSIYSFAKTKFNLKKTWYPKKLEFETRKNKSIAIYTDKNNKKHIVYTKCPHLKCNLIFNEVEETWDCPCHGSRFSIDGKCIEGPSNYDISYKEN